MLWNGLKPEFAMASRKRDSINVDPKIGRYDVFLVNLDPTAGREVNKTCPCVVVSPDAMRKSGMVVVCPLTTRLHPRWAHRIQIQCPGKPAEIMVDQIRAISINRMIKKIDAVSTVDAEALRNLIALLYASR